MSGGLQFNEETSRKVEALYLTPDVVIQRVEVLKALELREGEQVLDIGSGPGLLTYDIAASVGRDGRVCGIDISEEMLTISRRRCANQPWAEFQRVDATNLPYPDHTFDAAVPTQVYEYIAEIPTALAELYRVARCGSRIVILDTDYHSLVIHTEDEARMERMLSAWNQHFVHAGLPRTLSGQLRDAGFTIQRRDVIPMFNPEYHENTYGSAAPGADGNSGLDGHRRRQVGGRHGADRGRSRRHRRRRQGRSRDFPARPDLYAELYHQEDRDSALPDRRPDHDRACNSDTAADGHRNGRRRFPGDVIDDGQRATFPDAERLAHW
jgi:arsenite methyltransferase